jgi:hypothetical protein
VAAQIVASQFVSSFKVGQQIAGQLLGTQRRSFLNADPMGEEKVDVGRNGQMFRGFAFGDDIETVNARISLLAKSEVSKFHEGFPFYAPTQALALRLNGGLGRFPAPHSRQGVADLR